MLKRTFLLCVLLSYASIASANWYQDIINAITKEAGITNGLLDEGLSIQRDMLDGQQSIEGLMGDLNGHMTGHSGYGNRGFKDYQSYGDSARDWSRLMTLASRGQGSGAIGKLMNDIARQFPIDQDHYNRGVSDSDAQRYYAMKAQTILAARTASQVDFNQIQDQIAYQQMLRDKIDEADDLKAAMDLSNRIQIEGNLISLQLLRQTALYNQQQAVEGQAAVINALANAKFLTKK